MSLFSEAELTQLSAEIDMQLRSLRQSDDAVAKSGTPKELETILAKQMEVIAQSTKEPPRTVLQKIYPFLKRQLCEEGGELNEQWKTYGSLNNKDLLKQLEGGLIALGLTDQLPKVMVVIAVIILRLGVRFICEEFGQEP
jgi:hypothetical protein